MNKPAFDPLKPYDVVKPPFDPSKPFEAGGDVIGESVSAGVAAANDTAPKLGLLPAWDRAQGIGRAMVGNLQKQTTQEFNAVPNPIEVMQAGIKQAQGTADSRNAPTSQQLVDQQPLGRAFQKEGFKQSFADTPGVAPLRGLLAPAGASKSVGEAPNMAANMIESGVSDPASYIPGAAFEKPFEAGGKILGKVPGVGKAAAWAAEQTTGVSKNLWKHYAKHADEINQMAKNYVGENRFYQAFKDAREGWAGATQARKAQLGEMIEQGLKDAPRASKIPTKGILDELNTAKKTLHPEYDSAVIGEIDGMINKIRAVAPTGKMSAWDAYHTQRYLHDRAGRAFSEGGQIFNNSPKAANAAKAARYKATELVNKHFPDTIAKANKEFVELHNIDDILPKNLIDPEGSTAALRRAATDPNSREAEALKRLGKFIYGDESKLLHEAKNAAAFETMTSLPLNPRSGGGTTSTSRTLLGGGLGLGSQFSDDPAIKAGGAVAGAAIASPAVLKMVLDAGLMVPRAAKAVAGKGGLLEKGANEISPMLKALDGRVSASTKGVAEAAPGFLSKFKYTPGKEFKNMAPDETMSETILDRAKNFIKDEKGEFTPGQIKGLLNKQGTYDLKKAREVAGPAKGLLPGEAGGVINAESGLQNTKTDQIIKPLRSILDKVRSGSVLTPQEIDFVQGVESKIGFGRPLVNDIMEWHGINLRKANKAAEIPQVATAPDQPKGLLTSLNVEKGPVKELLEAGEAIPFNADARLKLDRQKSAGASGEFKPGQVIKDEDGRDFKILDVNKKTGMVMFETPDGGRSFEYADNLSQYLKDVADGPKQMADTKAALAAADAAEAERLKKNVVSLDVGKAKPKFDAKTMKKQGRKIPSTPTPSDPVESLIARYGADKTGKQVEKAIRAAQRPDAPSYVPEPRVTGIGWAPNKMAAPTGTIGESRILQPFDSAVDASKPGGGSIRGAGHVDPLLWADSKYGVTKKLIKEHANKNMPLTINTSSDLVAHADYIDAMPGKTTVNMHLLPDNDQLNRIIFPGNPSRLRQLEAIKRLRAAGVRVNAIEPTLEGVLMGMGNGDAALGADKVRKMLGQSPEELAQTLQLPKGGGKPTKPKGKK